MMALTLRSLDMLTSVQQLRDVEHLEPTRFGLALEADLGVSDETLATLGAQLDALHDALLAIEQLTRRAMEIRLAHVVAHETLSPQLRRLLAATVVDYAADLPLLRQRFHRYLSAPVLDEIIAVFHWVLALRQQLRDRVLSLAVQVALTADHWLQKALRSRLLEAPVRLRLRQARVDLHEVAKQPERIASARFAARLEKLPPLEDEPAMEEAAPGPQRFSLLEID